MYTSASRGRGRESHSRFEVLSWFFMRISGIVLLFIAVFHLLWMHLYIGLDNITFDTIVARWTGSLGAFWRAFDLALLLFAMIHGMNGLRWIIDDYIHPRGLNWAAKSVLFVVGLTLILMGSFIIFTFQPGVSAAAGI
jgi:succinate dehydrogenase / fumarate reductase membrane anchor subunit